MKKVMLLAGVAVMFLMSCETTQTVRKSNDSHLISNADEVLMNRVQKDALKYFWDYAEPNSMLGRERYHEDGIYPQNDKNVITTGGSGFGMMTILVGVERKFIPRKEAVKRLTTMADFLAKSDRHHGAWSHWINGETGKTVPFGKKDNGGDLVETAFLVQGIISVREYFKNGNQEEKILAQKMDDLWRGVEWNWYTKGGEKVLYWHWSPTYGWDMNFPLKGYDETLITYILAASSPTHSIDAETYYNGFTRNGEYLTTNTKYNLPLYVKHNGAEEYGGPLFWAQYSYLGLDPTGLSDRYIKNYFDLNRNHVLIDYEYCVENPKHWKGYGPNYWGLSAGYTRNQDGSVGYTAHNPKNDHGVITPTAALSSFPYTPKESMDFLRFLYNEKPEFIGSAGPYDATSINYDNWFTPRYLAIDQGTISPMIENYRTGLIWNLFMNAPEIKAGLKKLDFKSSKHSL
ncbi:MULTISPECIES: glucoamylase family protein [unclassified Kaistella]|uniref:glucoamylase family protein n=1 Tax=unclassified Kaistella TaxID=2762626 RepID=UPI002734E495|nr:MULTISPECIES: glucoamylase family protein [unclassified Kaistella]MDP2453088.1 glucoamylase family protein [Kaistella sp. SH11-4b]MDP2456145.1 glucoamylase family protein [Kaistella sp. SH40-3]MDP2458901.1 glucoamylase family protein [Kaistella sp. SH19-2b]